MELPSLENPILLSGNRQRGRPVSSVSVKATAVGIGANIILAYQGIKVLRLIIDARLKDMATTVDGELMLQ